MSAYPFPRIGGCLALTAVLVHPLLAFAAPATGPQSDGVLPSGPTEAETLSPAALTGATRLDADGLFEAESAAYIRYMRGIEALDAGDPDAAMVAWDAAVRTLPDERPYARSRGALALRLVMALQLRFARDGDLEDLRQQWRYLLGYQQRLPEMFADDAEARQRRHASAQLRIDQLAVELERFEGEHGTEEQQLHRSLRGEYVGLDEAHWRPDPDDIGWHARPDDPRKHASQATDGEVAPEDVLPPDEELPPEPRKLEGTGLIVSGAVLGLAGLAGLGVGVAGVVVASRANTFDPMDTPAARHAQIARGRRGNVQAIVGLAAGGALTVVGVALAAVGGKKRRRSSTALAVSGLRGPFGFSAHVSGRF